MRIGNFNLSFKKDIVPPQHEVSYSESSLYTAGDFKRYNPDDLIGRKGYDVYRKMLRTDEQIKAAVRFRRNAATSRGWGFKFPDNNKLPYNEQELRIKVLTKAIKSMPGKFTDSMNGIMSSMQYGFSLSEKTFKSFDLEGTPYWGVKAISLKPFDTFVFNVKSTGELDTVTQEIDGQNIKINMKRMIHHVHNADTDKHYGQSELREAYRSFWSKDVIIKLENIFLERMAGGLAWIEPTGSATVTKGTPLHTDITNILNNIQTKTGILLPKDFKLNLESPKDTEAFDRATSKHDRSISKALLMPNLIGLSDQGDTGSYGQSQTQLEAYLWMLDAEAKDLAETINEQLIEELGMYNFADGVYPEFYFKPLSKAMLKVIIDVWNTLVKSGAVEASDTDEEYLRELLEFPEKGETLSKPEIEDPTLPSIEEPGLDEPGTEEPSQEPIEETIVGNELLLTRAQSRVDFAAIERSTEILLNQGVNEFATAMQDIVEYVANQLITDPELATNPETVRKFKIQASLKTDLKKTAKRMLTSGWRVGRSNAQNELKKAGLDKRFAALTDEAAKSFFESKSFTIAGKLNDDALLLIKNSIFTGIKYSKSTEQIIESIYMALGMAGMLERSVVEDLLGEALNVKNPLHRLENIVRTNTFEAVNEARFSLFTGSDVRGFVVSLQYSAILDSVTTPICTSLDGKVLLVTASEWDSLRPPNHYQCRSLLIAITVTDTEKVTGLPESVSSGRVSPLEGFS